MFDSPFLDPAYRGHRECAHAVEVGYTANTKNDFFKTATVITERIRRWLVGHT